MPNRRGSTQRHRILLVLLVASPLSLVASRIRLSVDIDDPLVEPSEVPSSYDLIAPAKKNHALAHSFSTAGNGSSPSSVVSDDLGSNASPAGHPVAES